MRPCNRVERRFKPDPSIFNEAILFFFNRYAVDKLDEEKSFQIDLSLVLCIDNNCETIPVFSKLLVPIPFCNPNGTFSLPGNGTLAGVLEQFGTGASEAAIDLVLSSLGIKVIKHCLTLV